jgi:hypothetical protein
VLDIVGHQNIRLSDVFVSDILDSDHLPVIFHILDHVKTRNLPEPVETLTDWERLQYRASDLISPRIEIKWAVKGEKEALDFTASIVSAYRLSTRTFTLSDLHNDLPPSDHLLLHT